MREREGERERVRERERESESICVRDGIHCRGEAVHWRDGTQRVSVVEMLCTRETVSMLETGIHGDHLICDGGCICGRVGFPWLRWCGGTGRYLWHPSILKTHHIDQSYWCPGYCLSVITLDVRLHASCCVCVCVCVYVCVYV